MNTKLKLLAWIHSVNRQARRCGIFITAVIAIGILLWGGIVQSWAAEPTFVGILAFLDDPEVAKQLDLSDEQREKLTALIESREAEALELALQLRNLSPGERAERLLPFRRESERRGLALLTPSQQKQLQQIRLQKLGLASLAEEDVSSQLGLTQQQKAEVAKILREREDRLAVTSKDRAHIVRTETERQLAQLLSPEQKSRWEALLSSGPVLGSSPRSSGASPPKETSAVPAAAEKGPSELAAGTKPASASGKPEESSKPDSPKSESALGKSESAMEKPEGGPLTPGPSQPSQAADLSKPAELPKPGEPGEVSKPTDLSPPPQQSKSTDVAKTPTEFAKPSPEIVKTPTEVVKPSTEVATPPPEGATPSAELVVKPHPEVTPSSELPKPGELPSSEASPKSEPLGQPKEGPKAEQVPKTAEVPKFGELPKPTGSQRSEWPKSAEPSQTLDLAKPQERTPLGPTPSGLQPAEAPKPDSVPLVPLDQVKLRFNFRYQPWKDVLEWFAQQAGLSLIMDDPPKGTFNYTDDKAYSPSEAIDLLNSVLQTKGYVLVRRNRMLMVINLENGIPPLLIDTIPVEELDRRGTYEVVSVLFQLQKLTPEEIEGEVQKMIGPQGSVISLPKSRQLLVTETVGRLRAIRRAIERAEDPEGIHRQQQLRQVALQYASPQDVLPVLRQFLDIPADQAAAPDGSIRVVPDPTGKALLVSGKEEKINRLIEVLKFLDIPENAVKSQLNQTPQLEVYSVAPADPNSVLAVIQTLLAGSPDARVAIDPKTGNLIALCKPTEHATIRATLEQMQADPRKIEVIQLSKVDPQTAATSIKKLFGIGDTPDPNKPQIEVDTTAKQLLVRATQSQLEQIKLLLEKMGETGEVSTGPSRGGNVRMVPLTGRTAQDALDRALEIWPTMYKNRIRVVRPSAVIPTMRPSSEQEGSRSGSGWSSESGSSASGGMESPEGLLEQLFGPLGLPQPAGESSSSPLRTRIIRPPAGASSPGGGAGPAPGGSPPGPTPPPGSGSPSSKPSFTPDQSPGSAIPAPAGGPGVWRPAGPHNSSRPNPPMPGNIPVRPETNLPAGTEKSNPSGGSPSEPPPPLREKTAQRSSSSAFSGKPRIILASCDKLAQPEDSGGQSACTASSGTERGGSVPMLLVCQSAGPSLPSGTTPSTTASPAASSSEKPMADKLPAEKLLPGKASTEMPAAEKPIPDQSVPEQPEPQSSPPSSGPPISSGSPAPARGAGGSGDAGPAAKPTTSTSPSPEGSSGTGSRSSEEPPVIVVAPGPGGIMIASEDLDALDAFENLLNSIASNLPESNVTVFYLKHAKAEAVADLLERIFGASSQTSGGGPPMGGGRGLLGDLAGMALGDAGGGILGTLLGLGGPGGSGPGGFTPTGTIQITPDPRLNALIVQANPKDTEMIEELLKILDQEKGPEPVAVQPKARVIPVFNTAAEDIADLLREVYSDRLIGGGGGQRPPSPQEFIQMLRGGGGGRRGAGGSGQVDIQQKMAIGVDSRNNAIIVVAPDQLFQEVEQLVKQLDAAAAESNQTIRVVNLRNANPAAVQQALSALMGSNVQFGRTSAARRSGQQQGQPGQQQPGFQGQMPWMMPGGSQGFPGFGGQFRQFQGFQGQLPAQGGAPFQGGGFGRQGRFSRSGR
ncbi:MAG: hypothetical protein NZ602_02380 [Thermoguttaceae bacterium]|nr:hypothetical protein [Thermoguttaceae bacterium]MDW8037147.1 secretin N-terminal domain-containing protein [Thermoguttaceae bacterium]